ncbi:5394_t:CDS:1, partial [Ambispora gerdemannii]
GRLSVEQTFKRHTSISVTQIQTKQPSNIRHNETNLTGYRLFDTISRYNKTL